MRVSYLCIFMHLLKKSSEVRRYRGTLADNQVLFQVKHRSPSTREGWVTTYFSWGVLINSYTANSYRKPHWPTLYSTHQLSFDQLRVMNGAQSGLISGHFSKIVLLQCSWLLWTFLVSSISVDNVSITGQWWEVIPRYTNLPLDTAFLLYTSGIKLNFEKFPRSAKQFFFQSDDWTRNSGNEEPNFPSIKPHPWDFDEKRRVDTEKWIRKMKRITVEQQRRNFVTNGNIGNKNSKRTSKERGILYKKELKFSQVRNTADQFPWCSQTI